MGQQKKFSSVESTNDVRHGNVEGVKVTKHVHRHMRMISLHAIAGGCAGPVADVAADATQIASFSSVSNLSWTNSAMTVVRSVAQPVRNWGRCLLTQAMLYGCKFLGHRCSRIVNVDQWPDYAPFA